MPALLLAVARIRKNLSFGRPPGHKFPMVLPGRKTLHAMFGVDLRSVALLRIGLAVMLLTDLAVNASGLRTFFTDEGVLPRSVLLDTLPPSLSWYPHLAGGGVWFEGALFALQAALALMLLVGYRTRLAAFGSYALLLSMEARNPYILYGADMMLRLGLFWALFLPLADRCSVDAALGRVRPAREHTWLGVAGFAFMIQVGLSYTIGALLKSGPTWLVDHTAVAYALSVDIFRRPFGQWLGQFHGLMHAMTIAVRQLEIYGPLLFIAPVWSWRARLLGVVGFAAMQAGFGVCMQMGFFGPVMVALTLILLPAEFWTDWAAPVGQRLAAWPPAAHAAGWWRGWLQRHRRSAPPEPSGPARSSPAALALGWGRDAGLLFLIGFVVCWNLAQIPGLHLATPPGLNWIARGAGLGQRFDMFAPDPNPDDGWYVMRGTMRNGGTVNVFTGASPAVLDKPADVPASFGGERWMMHLLAVWPPDNQDLLQPLAQFLGREWNRSHADDDQLATLEIILLDEPTLPDLTKPLPTENVLWTEVF